MEHHHNDHDHHHQKPQKEDHDHAHMHMHHDQETSGHASDMPMKKDPIHSDSDDHHKTHDHSTHSLIFKRKFFVSLIFGLPILMISPLMGIDLPFQLNFPGSDWVVVVLATILFIYGGEPFITGAKSELKHKKPAMMTLISLGLMVAYTYSIYAFIANTWFHDGEHVMDFFWEFSSLILIMLLGHWIEMDAVNSASNALHKMASLLPSEALKIELDGSMKRYPLESIQISDHLLVGAGENIPADGIVIEGRSFVNEALITGEALEIEKNLGDRVIGGAVNGSGTIKIEVTGTGSKGYLAQVMALVEQASHDKSKSESMADTVATWLFYLALGVGFTALIAWTWMSGLNTGVERMVTVLVIACPHALGLAIPLVTARSTSLGAQNGLLVKSRQAIEQAPHVDVVVMDKTGTLTYGHFEIREIISNHDDYSSDQVLTLFASLEQSSSHPLALSIVKYAKDKGFALHAVTDVQTIPGVGLKGMYDGSELKIVSGQYLKTNNYTYDVEGFTNLVQQGYSISYLLVNDLNVGLIAQGDKIREDAKAIINELKQRNIVTVVLSGDNQASVDLLGQNLGIDEVYGNLLPEDKERIIKTYQDKGHRVMMVGDGINDAPSLMRANIGVAIGAGTDVAIDSADVILVKSNPSDIVHFLNLAYNTSRKMKQNLWWGAGYNFIAIPLAAGILAGLGFVLTPAMGAFLMSSSTIIVAFNALLLKIK